MYVHAAYDPKRAISMSQGCRKRGGSGAYLNKGGQTIPPHYYNSSPPSDFQTFRHPWAFREALLFFTLMGSCRPLWELIMRWPLPTRPCLKVEPEIQKVQQRLKKQNTNNRTTICKGLFVAFIAFKLKSIIFLIKVNSKWCKSDEIVFKI